MRAVLTIVVIIAGVVMAVLAGEWAPARASDLVTDLSDDRIEIRYTFKGVDLILFGTVGPIVDEVTDNGYDVVVVVRGPQSPITVRRKERMAGIWVNRESQTFSQSPGYYAVAATRSLADVASPDLLNSLGIGFYNLGLSAATGGEVSPVEEEQAFSEALYRLNTRAGLYRQELDRVQIIDGALFRTNVTLPANVPVGAFDVDAFIFVDGSLKAKNRISMTVDKEGFERAVYTMAQDFPFFYGMLAVVIALFAGWLAGVVGKK